MKNANKDSANLCQFTTNYSLIIGPLCRGTALGKQYFNHKETIGEQANLFLGGVRMTSLKPFSGANISIKAPAGEDLLAPEKKIDALIKAGWRVLDSDFDETAFLHWRERAYECLEALLGPQHVYTKRFRISLCEPKLIAILSRVGILGAAIMGSELQPL